MGSPQNLLHILIVWFLQCCAGTVDSLYRVRCWPFKLQGPGYRGDACSALRSGHG
jgi:hypothetical protein